MTHSLDRRDFLRGSTALGAGLLWTPSLWAQDKTANTDDINIALIGVGTQGDTLMNTCLKMGDSSGIRFKAVCDIWEDFTLSRVVRILKKYGHEANAYTDYQAMLAQEKDLDAVIIATPDFCHAEQSIACLKAGLHVYCEAPMSHTLASARSMVQAARQADTHLQIGFQRRSNPRYVHCWENLINGAGILGRITAVDAQWNRAARADRGWSRRRVLADDVLAQHGYKSMHQFRNWMWYRGLGSGPVAFYGSHQIDVLNWFLGATPKTVTARGGTHYYDPKTHEWYDTVMAVLEYETSEGVVSASYQTINSNGYGKRHEVFMGDQGSMEMSEGHVGIYHDPEAPDWDKWVKLGFLQPPGATKPTEGTAGTLTVKQSQPPASYQLPIEMNDPFTLPHLANFFATIRGQAQLSCPPEVAYAATATTLKINDAIESQKSLTFTPEDLTV
ncbi:MAG: Gfo/Idh/MocA family oxidoreductase [Phycisphaeraceae bacterium]|nr:Gfo/Idh/MocA family oxidoreductase [Phycisphaeraceae bacterium]